MIHDLTGMRFGKLLVVSLSEKKGKNGHSYYLCKCDCGKEKLIDRSHLITGSTKSCGCGVSEAVIKRCTTHGMSHTRLFTIWQGIKRRCLNKNDCSYGYYGGRGISLCDEWKNDFISFSEWALCNGYKEDLSIERINVNGDYCPDNCCWIPMKDQQNNKTNSVVVEINGKLDLITHLCKECPVSTSTVYQRIKGGYSVKDALTMKDRRYMTQEEKEFLRIR